MLGRFGTTSDEPGFSIASIHLDGCVVPVVEQIVLEYPFCRLRRFATIAAERDAGRASSAILVCAPLAGHHAVMLREVVQSLLEDNVVYVTDWCNARHVPMDDGPFHLNDYVLYIQRFIREIGAESLHVVAVCQATVPALGAIALLESQDEPTPRSLTLIGGPVDARCNPTAIGRLASSQPLQWFQRNLVHPVPRPYAGAGRQVCPSFVQIAGLAAAEPSTFGELYCDYWLGLARGDAEVGQKLWQALRAYGAVLDMAAEFYLDTIRTVFQEFQLVLGTWQVQGQPVRPQDIQTTALLTIEGELDKVSGRGQTHAAHDLCLRIAPHNKQFVTVPNCGHYGLFSGHTWRTEVLPSVRNMTRPSV